MIMKRKNYSTLFGVLAVVLGLLYACKRTEAADPDLARGSVSPSAKALTKEVPTVANGWLRFADMKAFNNIMGILHEKYQNPGELQLWERQFKGNGYTSLRERYRQIDADTTENRREPTVDSLINSNKLLDCPDSWFATVLSKDGFVQIADTVYCFKPGNEKGEAYAIPARYGKDIKANTVPAMLPGTKVHHTSFIKIPGIRWPEQGNAQTGPPKLPICTYTGPSMPNFWGQSGGDIYGGDNGDTFPEHNGRTVKLNYHRWRVGYIFYASTGIRVKMWKKTRFAGWQSVTYADQMIMEACCKGYAATAGTAPYPFNSTTSPAWPGFTKYAENNFEKTMLWVGSPIFSEILLEHFNFHFLVNYRGRVAERSIRQ